MWIGGFAALSVASLAGVWSQHDAMLCSGAEAELAEVWSDGRREAVRTSFVGTGPAYAPDVYQRTRARLDAWGEDWVAMRTQTCEATRRAGGQSEAVMDLRMACLHRARQGLDAAATVLGDASVDVVQHAHEVDLPQLAKCADIEALQADVEPPDSDEAEVVEIAGALLAEAAARGQAGEYERSLEAVQSAEALLEGTGYLPIRAELELRRGIAWDARGLYEDAEQALQRARSLAAMTRQHDLLREATVRLMVVLGYRLHRPAEALALRGLAAGLAAGSAEAEAQFHENLATVLHVQGKYEDAEREYRSALASATEANGERHVSVARSRVALASIFEAQGKYAEAEGEYRASVDLIRGSLGDDHPEVAFVRSNLAATLYARGEYAESESEHRAALATRISSLGDRHPDVARSHENLGVVLHAEGNYEEAESELRAALALWGDTLGRDHPGVANVRTNLGAVLQSQGKHAAAEIEHRAALALRLEELGPEHPDVATSRNNLGVVLVSQGKYEEAESEHREALAVRLAALGDAHPFVAVSRRNLGFALQALGRYEEAESEHRTTVALIVEALGADHPDLAQAKYNLVEVLQAQGKHAEAEAEFRASLAGFRQALGERHPHTVVARRSLADTLAAQGKHEEALELREGSSAPAR